MNQDNIESIAVLAKLDNGKMYQVYIKDESNFKKVIEYIVKLNKSKAIQLLNPEISGVDIIKKEL